MKKLLLFLLFPTFLFAEDKPIRLRFAWDYPETERALITGFKLYFSNTSQNYVSTNSVDQGNNLTGKLEGLKSRTQYFFVATAVNALSGLESDYSNEVEYMTPEYRPTLKLMGSVVSFLSPPGDSFLIEQSNNFVVWGGLATGTESGGEVRVNLQTVSEPYLFFRARLLPRESQTMMKILSEAMVIKLPPIPLLGKKRFQHVDERKGAELLMDMLKQSRKPRLVLPPMPGEK
jgi:hypothetical protein